MEHGDPLATVYKQFIEKFNKKSDHLSGDDHEVAFRVSTFSIEPSEVEAECLEWIRRYLSLHDCPSGLISQLTRNVYTNFEDSVNLIDFYLDSGQEHAYDVVDGDRSQGSSVDHSTPPQIDAGRLQQDVLSCIHATVKSWGTSLPMLTSPSTFLHVCSHAIRNQRRKMEDRHVIIPDLNVLFELKDSPSQSYFAIFDGHCGMEAAEYAATHLHYHLVRDPLFNTDPELAMKRAYKTTDIKFLEKANRESLRSGTTGVSALIRGSDLYVSWLGDSQAILVCRGQPVQIMKPHKPEREDEKKRIEALGGCVLFSGAWRVNGSISVSRAIGDASFKPYISNDADALRISFTGEEEYLVMACDGLWDVLTPSEIVNIIYKHSLSTLGGVNDVAAGLVHAARELGSSDNISVIVVLFKSSLSPPQLTSDAGFHFGFSLVTDRNLEKLATGPYPKSSALNENIKSEVKDEFSLRK